MSPTPGHVANGLIAYTHDRGGIWTIKPDGSQAENIAEGGYVPAWSPDGTKIAFIRELNGRPAIHVMDADGTNVDHLKDVPPSNHDLAWSPDGTQIAYTARGDIYVMNADGFGSRQITRSGPQGLDLHPTWSPDGSRIAFARFTFDEPLSSVPGVGDSPSGSGIYVVTPAGGELTRLTEGPDPDAGLDEWPDWSPDGRKIVFQRAFEIYLMNVDGSDLKKLTSGGVSLEPSWSPDQRKIVHQRANWPVGLFELFVMNADGSALTRLPILRATDFSPDWQPLPRGAVPTSAPTGIPAPTASPLPATCDASSVTGDFEGDDRLDLAVVTKTNCLTEPTDHYGSEYALRVEWFAPEGGHAATGIAPLSDCRKLCKAVAAADLNGDGIDEFILMVDKGASTDFFQVYELPGSEAFGRPALVARPGGRHFPPGEPAEFALFGSVTHFWAIGCDRQGVMVLAAVENPDPGEYSVHETRLQLRPTDSPPFATFDVLSERDYEERFDEGFGQDDQMKLGEPCWNYGP